MSEYPLDPVEELAAATHGVVSKKKVGLTPVVHLPDDEDPEAPACQVKSRSGLGFKRYSLEHVEPEQICGTCLGRDKNSTGDTGLSAFLEKADADVVGGRS